MSEDQKSQGEEGIPYKFDCYRGGMHRNIMADGAWILVNATGRIILNFFSDSPPLPKTIILETEKDGSKFTSKPAQIIPVSDAGALRQYEVSVHLTVDAARFLVANLQHFIEISDNLSKANHASRK